MAKPKSTTAVMTTLKKELKAENPEEVLTAVETLRAANEFMTKKLADDRGPLAVVLAMDRTALKYNHALAGTTSIEDFQRIQGMVDHFSREVLGLQIRQLEVEAEVQRRLSANGKEMIDGE